MLAAPLLESLSDEDPKVRTEAINGLGGLDEISVDVHEALENALEDDSSKVRRLAATVLGYRGSSSASAVLAKRLEREPNEDVRATLAVALRRRGSAAATSTLQRALLSEESENVRLLIVWALAACGESGIPPLVDALADTHSIAREAVWMLGRMGTDAGSAKAHIRQLAESTDDHLICGIAGWALNRIDANQ